MKHYLIYPALALLLCVAVSLRLNLPMTRSLPVVGKLGSTGNPGISGDPMSLTPQQRAAFDKAGRLETAARAAKARGDYARAEAYYRAETQVPRFAVAPWTWVDLGLMLDYQGKRGEAYQAYLKGLGPGNSRAGPGLASEAEADARFGIMCEDRGLHVDSCECYYAWRTKGSPEDLAFLDLTLAPDKTSSALVRSLLNAALGITLEQERPQPNPEALAAFQAAVRLAPDDPRPELCLAYGLRRAGRFREAEAALHEVSILDKDGRFRVAAQESLAEDRGRSRAR